jgi:hypothetical protein
MDNPLNEIGFEIITAWPQQNASYQLDLELSWGTAHRNRRLSISGA